MKIDEQLIRKMSYESLMEEKENQHPIKVLGDLYMAEQQKDVPDLSFIRFAQGEIYFHNRDYEAAIFKWENITNELEPWAKKNLADAYFELQLLSTAEDIYKSIQTESDVLRIEVLLQLFSLYLERGKLEMAVEAIKQVVLLQPDYPDVTDIARAFFEEHKDWKNAVGLAINEAIRTKELSWFEILQTYVEQGHTAKMEPNDFNLALVTLYKEDLARFESLTVSFWNSYIDGEYYFSWIKEINHILLNMEGTRNYTWRELSIVYNDTYFELINGKHLIRNISHLIPNHLMNWMRIANQTHALIASASTLAWSEIFTSNIDHEWISEAEKLVTSSVKSPNGLTECYKLFEAIISWAEQNEIELGQRFEWIVKELLDLNAHHLLIAGTVGNGKSVLINTLLGEEVSSDSNSVAVMFKDSDITEITEITDERIRVIDDLTKFENSTEALIQCKMPFGFLKEKGIALIDTPVITGRNEFRNGVFQYLKLADSLLFVLDAEDSFTENELEMMVKIREHAPELPIHFLLNEMNSEQEIIDLVTSRVNTYFPKSRVFAYSGQDQLETMIDFIKGNRNLNEERILRLLQSIRKTIKYLLERRVEIENSIINSIKWNEEIVTKLKGATNQLRDLEEEKIRIIKREFRKIKDGMKDELMNEIPRLLQNCSEFIKEDSDLGKIHLQLNNEMNRKVQNYMEEVAMPSFHHSFQNWIAEAHEEFEQGQYFLNEMSAGFNDLYGEEKLKLDCDFRVLDDWRRDDDRMTMGSIQLEKENILLRFTPSQFLYKSAGKLFGAFHQNNMLHNKYKQFIENEDYSVAAASIVEQVIQPFDLFEKSLDRDIKMFFKNPLVILNQTVSDTEKEIEDSKEALHDMSTNPETYRDPLTLFQLKLRQYEWMTTACKRAHQYR